MEILFSHITDEMKAGWIETDRYANGNLRVQLKHSRRTIRKHYQPILPEFG